MIPSIIIHLTNNTLFGLLAICFTLCWIAWIRRGAGKPVEK